MQNKNCFVFLTKAWVQQNSIVNHFKWFIPIMIFGLKKFLKQCD